MLKAIIFDYDGIIVDSEVIHLKMFQRVLDQEGITLREKDYFAKYLAMDDRGCFCAVLQDNGRRADEAVIEDLIARKSRYFNEFIKDHLTALPGAVDFIKKVSKRFPLAIASGSRKGEIEFGLNKFGLRDEFDQVVGAEDVKNGKPDPESFLKALKLLREKQCALEAWECLVVEDSIHGVQAAKEAGMKCLAVTNSYPAEKLASADLVIEDLEDCDLDEIERIFDR